MDEEVLNIQIRKFLKKVGINSQREIEKAVREQLAAGTLEGSETLRATMILRVPDVGVDLSIDDDIALQ